MGHGKGLPHTAVTPSLPSASSGAVRTGAGVIVGVAAGSGAGGAGVGGSVGVVVVEVSPTTPSGAVMVMMLRGGGLVAGPGSGRDLRPS